MSQWWWVRRLRAAKFVALFVGGGSIRCRVFQHRRFDYIHHSEPSSRWSNHTFFEAFWVYLVLRRSWKQIVDSVIQCLVLLLVLFILDMTVFQCRRWGWGGDCTCKHGDNTMKKSLVWFHYTPSSSRTNRLTAKIAFVNIFAEMKPARCPYVYLPLWMMHPTIIVVAVVGGRMGRRSRTYRRCIEYILGRHWRIIQHLPTPFLPLTMQYQPSRDM